MASITDYLKRPVTIQGKEVVLVPDMVGPVPISEQHQYVESTSASNTCPAIHVRESDIEEMRERFPDAPVYGMWSVLILSGLVTFKRTLQVVPISGEDGYYIHCDLGRAEYSGIYESGFFAADAGFSLDEAQVIEGELDQFILPDNEAKLAAEMQFERQLVLRRAWSYLSIVVMAVVAIGFTTDFALAKIYDQAHQHIKSKTAMLQDLQSGLARLQTTRLTEVPNNEEAIERLAALWAAYPNMETTSDQSFDNKKIKVTVNDVKEDPVNKFDWLDTQYDPNGIWTLGFKTKGS